MLKPNLPGAVLGPGRQVGGLRLAFLVRRRLDGVARDVDHDVLGVGHVQRALHHHRVPPDRDLGPHPGGLLTTVEISQAFRIVVRGLAYHEAVLEATDSSRSLVSLDLCLVAVSPAKTRPRSLSRFRGSSFRARGSC